jgi:hypothetical protein
MTIPPDAIASDSQCYFAKLLIALELRRTHGTVFTAAFLRQYEREIALAVSVCAERLRADRHERPDL